MAMMNKELFFPADMQLDEAHDIEFCREEFIYNVTRDLLVFMEESEVTKADVAKKLNKSKAYVSQVLNGSRNMTLGTLSDICFVIGAQIKIDVLKAEHESSKYNEAIQEVDFIKTISFQKFNTFLYSEKKPRDWHDCEIIEFKAAS